MLGMGMTSLSVLAEAWPLEKPSNSVAEAEEKVGRRKCYIVQCGWRDANKVLSSLMVCA